MVFANFKLYIDNTEVTNFVRSWTGKGPDEDTLILDYTFEIGQANDITNGKFLTWNTTKNIKIKVREYSSSGHEVKFYSRGYWEGSYQYGTDGFVCPSLEIIAIGESSGQAVTLTNNSVNDLSDISFNSTTTTDGQALVWNSTDGVWEAGAVASSGGGLTDLSATSINDLSDVSFNSTSTTQGSSLIWNNTDKVWEAGTPTTSIVNTTTTVTNSGGWVNLNATNTPSYDYIGDIVYDNNDGLYFVGGRENSNNSTVRNYVWKYTISTNTWGQLTTTGTFHSIVSSHNIVFYNNAIYLFGGWNFNVANYNDLYKLDLTQSTPTWSLISTNGTISARREPSLAMYNSKLIVFGGYTTTKVNDVYEIDPSISKSNLGSIT